MKMYVQYATDPAQPYQQVDSSEWASLPYNKNIPVDNQTVSDKKEYIHSINIQGVVFNSYDHYCVLDNKVIVWNDDPVDWVDDRYAMVWVFEEIQYDKKVDTLNTKQSIDFYVESDKRFNKIVSVNKHRYSEFKEPDALLTKHGIWVPDDLNEKLLDLQESHGWREWIN